MTCWYKTTVIIHVVTYMQPFMIGYRNMWSRSEGKQCLLSI